MWGLEFEIEDLRLRRCHVSAQSRRRNHARRALGLRAPSSCAHLLLGIGVEAAQQRHARALFELCEKFSKVRVLVNLLYEVTVESTFEIALPRTQIL